jgi:DNA repair exonuclease SbcCD ATPase subunit
VILERIEAKNYGRFKDLVISDFPDRGLIGIVGPNESGKTTIGDLICFALFGRTVHEHAAEQHIHWKEDEMRLAVQFRDVSGNLWEIVRELDRAGTYSAVLTRRDGDGEEIRGVGKVLSKVEELLLLNFHEFNYAFYLGQKELDVSKQLAKDAKRHLIDELTGVGTIERVTDSVSLELENLHTELVSVREELRLARRLIKEYDTGGKSDLELIEAIKIIEVKEAEIAQSVADTESQLERAKEQSEEGCKLFNYLRSLKTSAYAHILSRRHKELLNAARTKDELIARKREELSGIEGVSGRRDGFRQKIKELTAAINLRHVQIKRSLENKLPSEILPSEVELISPDGKMEQLVVTRLRSSVFVEEVKHLKRERNQFFVAFAMAGLFALICNFINLTLFGFLSTKALFFFFAVSSGIFLFYSIWSAVKQRRQNKRVEAFKQVALKLESEVSCLRDGAKQCEEFIPSRLDNLKERLDTIGGGLIEEFYTSLVDEYDDFLNSRVKYVESERKASVLSDEISDEEDIKSSIKHVLSELESWFGRFNSSPFFKLPDEAEVEVEGLPLDHAGIQALSREMVREIEACQKLLFHLEQECRSPLSPKICSSFSNFMDIATRLLKDHGDNYGLNYDDLRKLQKGDFSIKDPLDFLTKQEQRLSIGCPSSEELNVTIDKLRETLGNEREELGRIRLEKIGTEQQLATVAPDAARCRKLEQEIEVREASLKEHEKEISVREMLLNLLTGLAGRMRDRLGPALADYIRCVLPHITGGRYRDVQVTDSLEIQVYSVEKGDYVHMENLSGGTVDQLLVSLRMAFAKALMDSKMPDEPSQFLFFDEPLSSFDKNRAEAFLELLRAFGDNFAQIFLVSHLTGLDNLFDAVITTDLETDVLRIAVLDKESAGGHNNE